MVCAFRSESAGTADHLILTCLLMKPDKVSGRATLAALGGQMAEETLVSKVKGSAGIKG